MRSSSGTCLLDTSRSVALSLGLAVIVVLCPCVGFAQERTSPNFRRLVPGIEVKRPTQSPIFTEAALMQAAHDHLQTLDDCHRPFMRFFVFRHTYDSAGNGKAKTSFQALAKLTNSLSWAPWPGGWPEAEKEGAILLAFDLRHLQWDAKTWDRILKDYPYGATQDTADGRWVAEASGCKLPYVRADWFVFAASRPPLYHDILGIPETQSELERMLKIDVTAAIQLGRVQRSGFHKSQVSKHNRLVEVHITGYGGLWKSYDFKGSAGRRNLFAHPTGPAWGDDKDGFQPDGGEIIFSLPNAFQAYMLVNDKGNRINTAPPEIVADGASPRSPVITNGISCMGCHYEGIKSVPTDEIRSAVEASPNSFAPGQVAAVQALHPPREQLDGLAMAASRHYSMALQRAHLPEGYPDPISLLSSYYEAELDLPTAAAEAGVTADQFRKKTEQSSAELRRLLTPLLSDNGRVHREVFVEAFPQIVREWKFGEYQQPGSQKPPKSAPVEPPPKPSQSSPVEDQNPKAGSLNPAVFYGIGVPSLLLVAGGLLFVALRVRGRADVLALPIDMGPKGEWNGRDEGP